MDRSLSFPFVVNGSTTQHGGEVDASPRRLYDGSGRDITRTLIDTARRRYNEDIALNTEYDAS